MSRFAAIAAFLTVTAAYSSPALADFQRWSVGIEDDPFSGGKKVSVDYSETIRSGALIQCDTSQQGLRFRVVPGYVHTPVLEYATPTLEFAIDGKRLFAVKGTTGSVGDNLAIAEVEISRDQAIQLIDAFSSAKKQIAVKDGISTGPMLYKASGSTKAGQALKDCIQKQSAEPTQESPVVDADTNSGDEPSLGISDAIILLEREKLKLTVEQKARLANLTAGQENSAKPTPQPTNQCVVTRSSFENVEAGASLTDVQREFGCAGKEFSTSEANGIKMEIWQWNAPDRSWHVNMIFNNGQLASKSQRGL